MTARILLVEDNPISRKMARLALKGAGYELIEAGDCESAMDAVSEHAPDLVLLDIMLPDGTGYDLLRRIRALPGGSEIPILALSGYPSRVEEARGRATDFDDILLKPVEPSRLVEVVRAHLPDPQGQPADLGRGRRVLVADDDPVQLKLTRIALTQAGFRVTAVAGGEEALATARTVPPDALVTDVLMPGMDGYALCRAVRGDPALARVPVVLYSAYSTEESDPNASGNAGANAFVSRTQGTRALVATVVRAIDHGPPVAPAEPGTEAGVERARRLVRQLERQVELNAHLARAAALQATQTSVLAAISDAIARADPLESPLRDSFLACMDASGISNGALLLLGDGGRWRLEAQVGYRDDDVARLEALAARSPLVDRALATGVPVVLAAGGPGARDPDEADFLRTMRGGSGLALPLVHDRERLGALLVASARHALDEGEFIGFAKAVARDFALAVALTRVVGRLEASERRYRALVEGARDAVVVVGPDDRVIEANPAAEALLGRSRDDVVARPVRDLWVGADADAWADLLARARAEGGAGPRELGFAAEGGGRVPASVSASRVRVERWEAVLLVGRPVPA